MFFYDYDSSVCDLVILNRGVNTPRALPPSNRKAEHGSVRDHDSPQNVHSTLRTMTETNEYAYIVVRQCRRRVYSAAFGFSSGSGPNFRMLDGTSVRKEGRRQISSHIRLQKGRRKRYFVSHVYSAFITYTCSSKIFNIQQPDMNAGLLLLYCLAAASAATRRQNLSQCIRS